MLPPGNWALWCALGSLPKAKERNQAAITSSQMRTFRDFTGKRCYLAMPGGPAAKFHVFAGVFSLAK